MNTRQTEQYVYYAGSTTDDILWPTYGNLVFETICLLSKLLHFTHGDQSIVGCREDVRRGRSPGNEKESSGEAAWTKLSHQEIIKSLPSHPRYPSIPEFYLHLPVNLPTAGLQVSAALQVKPPPSALQTFSNFAGTYRETHKTHLHSDTHAQADRMNIHPVKVCSSDDVRAKILTLNVHTNQYVL